MSRLKRAMVGPSFIIFCGAAAAACAAEAATLPSSSPANPAGDEAPPVPDAAGTVTNLPARSSSSGAVYACPMHPEVTASSPGRCPKCGMELRPREGYGGGR
jgi:hypothetical protein